MDVSQDSPLYARLRLSRRLPFLSPIGIPPAQADGGASDRDKTSASAPDQTRAAIQAHAQRILRALSDDDTNNRVRYWQARADCDAAPAAHGGDNLPCARALLALTTAMCAQLDALFGVNPATYSPPGILMLQR